MGLNKRDHNSLALWATDCAEHAPILRGEVPERRPTMGSCRGRAGLARGKLKMSEARAAAIAARAAARTADRAAARAVARATGHAAATAHVAGHAPHAANYAVKAVTYAAVLTDSTAAASEERDWQYGRLPAHLRPVAFPARDN
jgi:hypothetical protein